MPSHSPYLLSEAELTRAVTQFTHPSDAGQAALTHALAVFEVQLLETALDKLDRVGYVWGAPGALFHGPGETNRIEDWQTGETARSDLLTALKARTDDIAQGQEGVLRSFIMNGVPIDKALMDEGWRDLEYRGASELVDRVQAVSDLYEEEEEGEKTVPGSPRVEEEDDIVSPSASSSEEDEEDQEATLSDREQEEEEDEIYTQPWPEVQLTSYTPTLPSSYPRHRYLTRPILSTR